MDKQFDSVNVLRSQNSEYLPMLKFDTGLINPIEREKTSHGVLLQFVVISFSSLYMIYFYDVICFVIVRFRPYLPRFPHRILDRIHVCPADIHALDRLKMLVSVSSYCPEMPALP